MNKPDIIFQAHYLISATMISLFPTFHTSNFESGYKTWTLTTQDYKMRNED